jgi:hypothetical protein
MLGGHLIKLFSIRDIVRRGSYPRQTGMLPALLVIAHFLDPHFTKNLSQVTDTVSRQGVKERVLQDERI